MCFQAVASDFAVWPRICRIFSFPEDSGPGGTWRHELMTFGGAGEGYVCYENLENTDYKKNSLKKPFTKQCEGNEDPYWFNLPLALISTELLMLNSLNSHSPSTEKRNVFPQGTALRTFTCLRESTLLEMKEEASCFYKMNVKWAPQRFLFIPLNLWEEEDN